MCLNSHKLPITTEFEALATDALAHNSRLDRSEKIVASKANAHNARSEQKKKKKTRAKRKCTPDKCFGPHDASNCFEKIGYP